MFDNDKYESIVNKYSQTLYKYCYIRLNKDSDLTEETLNDVFRVFYQKWDSLEIGENIGAYLFRVADMCINNARRSYNRYYSHNESYESIMAEKRSESAMHFDEYFKDDRFSEEEHIERIRQSLTKEDRDLFTDRYIEKKTLQEISESRGVPYSTLRYRLMKLDIAVKNIIKKILIE